MEITGGCFCSRHRYRIRTTKTPDVATCHCSQCRRSTGGTTVTWATVPLTSFQWEAASPNSLRSNEHTLRYFCGDCGTQLALFTDLAPETLDVTVTSMDHPERLAPSRHIWTANKLPWLVLNDGLPQEPKESL